VVAAAAGVGEVAFDGERELGEVGVADDAAELALGFEHPGGGPAQRHVAVLPALDVATGAADALDQRLAWVRALERALEGPADPEARERDGLLEALSQRAGGAGVGVRELVGELVQPVDGDRVVGLRPRRAQPPLDRRAVALGQVVEHVALLVTHTPLDRRVAAEHVLDGLTGSLRAVQHGEHALLGRRGGAARGHG
jgi:hypothetical protein